MLLVSSKFIFSYVLTTTKLDCIYNRNQHMLQLTRRLTNSSLRLPHASFATAKRSYYEILELEPNFSTKELRKKFLEKGSSAFTKPASTILTTISLKKPVTSSNCSNRPTKPWRTRKRGTCTIQASAKHQTKCPLFTTKRQKLGKSTMKTSGTVSKREIPTTSETNTTKRKLNIFQAVFHK